MSQKIQLPEKFLVGQIQPFPNGRLQDICFIADKCNQLIDYLKSIEEENISYIKSDFVAVNEESIRKDERDRIRGEVEKIGDNDYDHQTVVWIQQKKWIREIDILDLLK